jgi:hypothetical protein
MEYRNRSDACRPHGPDPDIIVARARNRRSNRAGLHLSFDHLACCWFRTQIVRCMDLAPLVTTSRLREAGLAGLDRAGSPIVRRCGVRATGVLRHPPLHRIAVLHWPRRFHPQVLLRLQDPIRLAQKFPADERQIGVTARNDLVSVVDIGNQSYCTGSDLHLVPNTPCARDLKSLRDWNARLWRRSARRNVDESVAEIRTKSGSSAGMSRRIASVTRSSSRIRFSSEPP